MTLIKQSTARTILVGPVLDSDGAAKTDEVVASIKVTKNGTVGAANGSATLTHDHAGKYKLALTASDTDTLGVLEISLNSGTNDMPVRSFNVVPANVFDSLVSGTDYLDSSLVQWLGVAPLALASQRVQSDLVAIHGTALTETDGQLAGRFVEFFDQESATFSIATELANFKASGFATPTNVTDARDALSDQIAGINIGSGSGARTISATVDDGSDPLEGAVIRLSQNGISKARATTDANGQATLNVDDGTYTVAITCSGYSYSGTSLVVSDDAAPTWSMTLIQVTASSAPDRATGQLTCLGTDGEVKSGVVITVTLDRGPGTAGLSPDSGAVTDTSDANGLVTFSGLIIGARYWASRPGRPAVQFTVPTDTDPFNLPEVLGTE